MMKLLAVVFVIFAMIASVMALKAPICGLEHSKDGDGVKACMAYMPSWSYDMATNECMEFIYGGCGGNENRFQTQEDCENVCKE